MAFQVENPQIDTLGGAQPKLYGQIFQSCGPAPEPGKSRIPKRRKIRKNQNPPLFIEFFRGRPRGGDNFTSHLSKCSRPFIQSVKSTLSHLKSCNPVEGTPFASTPRTLGLPCPSFPWFLGFPWLILSKEFPWLNWYFLCLFQGFCGFGSERKSLVNLRFFLGKTEKSRNGRTGLAAEIRNSDTSWIHAKTCTRPRRIPVIGFLQKNPTGLLKEFLWGLWESSWGAF